VDITLLSTNPPGTATSHSLHNGTLAVTLPLDLYARAGIPNGTPIKSGARRHGKEGEMRRFEIDLRGLTGKSGSSKLLGRWRKAAVEVWSERVECWVCVEGRDEGQVGEAREALGRVGAVRVEGGVRRRVLEGVRVPKGMMTKKLEVWRDEEKVWSLVEWADLVTLGSERVRAGDKVDVFVAHYEVPDKDGAETVTQDVVVLRWEGLLSSRWVTDLLLKLVRASRSRTGATDADKGEPPWAVLSVSAHQTQAVENVDGCVVYLQSDTATEDATSDGNKRDGEDQDMTDENDDAITEDRNTGGMDVDPDAQTRSDSSNDPRTGLRSFMCCQFVDSRVNT
jgi:ribonucleases P/MRP protein subunit RPP40